MNARFVTNAFALRSLYWVLQRSPLISRQQGGGLIDLSSGIPVSHRSWPAARSARAATSRVCVSCALSRAHLIVSSSWRAPAVIAGQGI